MPRARPTTLLPLATYAHILGLDPLRFSGGVSALRPEPSCSDVWYQYDWQDEDKVSREQVALLIQEAERDLADHLGYWPGPVWIKNEHHQYPRLYRRELTGRGQDVRFRLRSLMAKWGYVIEGGQRATEPLDTTAAFTTIDADGDGFAEVAQFVILNQAATLDPCEVHIYFKEYLLADAANTRTNPASTGADPAWEIRPIEAQLVGTTLTVWCKVWDLFRPQLYEELAPDPIDADAPGSYVDEVMVYRVFNDPQSQVLFLWGQDVACDDGATCAEATQTGCMRTTNPRNGLVVPVPSTYNATTAAFEDAAWSECYEPDALRLWYRAGLTSRHSDCETLDDYWARIIAMLATARFDWPLCTCNNSNPVLQSNYWRQDKSEISSSKSFLTGAADLGNPFGTRVGEIEAWKRIARSRGRTKGQAVIT